MNTYKYPSFLKSAYYNNTQFDIFYAKLRINLTYRLQSKGDNNIVVHISTIYSYY